MSLFTSQLQRGDLKRKVYLITLIACLLALNVKSQNKTLETSGDILFLALPASAFVTTLIYKDIEGTKQFGKGFVLNLGITLALKEIIDKQRPNNRNSDSFPSGHTSTTFQSASFLQQRYGWKLGLPAYVLAGFTGFTRIQSDQHDGWDVLAGAIVGIGSSYIFTTPYQKEHLSLFLNTEDKNYQLGFLYKF